MSREGVAEGAAEAPRGAVGVSRMTSWEDVEAPGKYVELKTIPATEIVLGYNAADEVIRKGLCEALTRKRESVSVDNFTRVGVEIARDTRAIIGIQGRALDPAFRRFG